MGLDDAEKLALTCLKETMEEKISKNNVEMMVVSAKDKQIVRMSSEKVENILSKLKWYLWFKVKLTYNYVMLPQSRQPEIIRLHHLEDH